MKKLLAVFIILLVSCASEQEEEAFKVIGDYYDAKVTYTKGFSSEVGKKSEKHITLNLKGGPYINAKKPDQLAVYAAVLLYANLSNDEVNKYTHIKINLFEKETETEAIYNRTYEIETIRNIASKSENFQKAAQLLLDGKPEDIYNLLIKDYQNPQEKERFVSVINDMNTERNGIKSIKLLGVELLIDNNTKERFLSFNGQVEWENAMTTAISVRTFEDVSINGLIHLNIK